MLKGLKKHGKHLLHAIQYSLKGLGTALRKEKAFQQEVIVLLLVIPMGLLFGQTGLERALLIGSWLFVIVIELINSAIEAAVDLVGFEIISFLAGPRILDLRPYFVRFYWQLLYGCSFF